MRWIKPLLKDGIPAVLSSSVEGKGSSVATVAALHFGEKLLALVFDDEGEKADLQSLNEIFRLAKPVAGTPLSLPEKLIEEVEQHPGQLFVGNRLVELIEDKSSGAELGEDFRQYKALVSDLLGMLERYAKLKKSPNNFSIVIQNFIYLSFLKLQSKPTNFEERRQFIDFLYQFMDKLSNYNFKKNKLKKRKQLIGNMMKSLKLLSVKLEVMEFNRSVAERLQSLSGKLYDGADQIWRLLLACFDADKKHLELMVTRASLTHIIKDGCLVPAAFDGSGGKAVPVVKSDAPLLKKLMQVLKCLHQAADSKEQEFTDLLVLSITLDEKALTEIPDPEKQAAARRKKMQAIVQQNKDLLDCPLFKKIIPKTAHTVSAALVDAELEQQYQQLQAFEAMINQLVYLAFYYKQARATAHQVKNFGEEYVCEAKGQENILGMLHKLEVHLKQCNQQNRPILEMAAKLKEEFPTGEEVRNLPLRNVNHSAKINFYNQKREAIVAKTIEMKEKSQDGMERNIPLGEVGKATTDLRGILTDVGQIERRIKEQDKEFKQGQIKMMQLPEPDQLRRSRRIAVEEKVEHKSLPSVAPSAGEQQASPVVGVPPGDLARRQSVAAVIQHSGNYPEMLQRLNARAAYHVYSKSNEVSIAAAETKRIMDTKTSEEKAESKDERSRQVKQFTQYNPYAFVGATEIEEFYQLRSNTTQEKWRDHLTQLLGEVLQEKNGETFLTNYRILELEQNNPAPDRFSKTTNYLEPEYGWGIDWFKKGQAIRWEFFYRMIKFAMVYSKLQDECKTNPYKAQFLLEMVKGEQAYCSKILANLKGKLGSAIRSEAIALITRYQAKLTCYRNEMNDQQSRLASLSVGLLSWNKSKEQKQMSATDAASLIIVLRDEKSRQNWLSIEKKKIKALDNAEKLDQYLLNFWKNYLVKWMHESSGDKVVIKEVAKRIHTGLLGRKEIIDDADHKRHIRHIHELLGKEHISLNTVLGYMKDYVPDLLPDVIAPTI